MGGWVVMVNLSPRLKRPFFTTDSGEHDDIGVVRVDGTTLRYEGDRLAFRLEREDVADIPRKLEGVGFVAMLIGQPRIVFAEPLAGHRHASLTLSGSFWTPAMLLRASRNLEAELRTWLNEAGRTEFTRGAE